MVVIVSVVIAFVAIAIIIAIEVEHIEQVADRRHIARHIGVIVATPKENAFSIVLRLGDGSIVTYDGRGGNPPYFVSLGDARKEVSLVRYFFGGQLSELPASHLIPQELAMWLNVRKACPLYVRFGEAERTLFARSELFRV